MLGILLSQLDNDDRAFMLDLYNNYYGLVRKTVYKIIKTNNDIEDLIDDTFVKLIYKIATIRSMNCYALCSYIAFTARSVSINHVKHKKVVSKHTKNSINVDISDSAYIEDDFEKRIIHDEEIKSLSEAVLKLPENEKNILYYKYFLEMDDAEIAEILEISPNSVRQYLTRARRNAKKLLEKEDSKYGK